MLRSVIISPDVESARQLEELLTELGAVTVVRRLDRYPNSIEMTRLLRAHAPEVIFAGAESVAHLGELVTVADQALPGAQIIAFDRACQPQVLLELMRVGVREFLTAPFERSLVYEALLRAAEFIEKKPVQVQVSDLVYSFLPSKGGVGASTVCLNTALAVAKLPGMETLLADFDLNNGIVRFLLKLDNTYTTADAAERAQNMDENLWPQLVSKVGNLDVLHAGSVNPAARMEHHQLRQLLEFMRRNYKAILIDLSGNMERFSLEVMQESKRVFIVCTPELTSIYLAREKLQHLRSLELGDRVSVLVNRYARRPGFTPQQIEELMGVPVMCTFANDYQGVSRAVTSGKEVDPSSELGRQFAQLARTLAERRNSAQEPKKRLVEYLSLLPQSMSLFSEAKKSA